MSTNRKSVRTSYGIAEFVSLLSKLWYTCATGDRALQRINFPIGVVQNAAKSLKPKMLKEASQKSIVHVVEHILTESHIAE